MDSTTVAIYEAQIEAWAARRGGATDDLGRRFRGLVGDGPILDAGCGPGRYLDQLGAPVIGLDATAAMLDRARRSGAVLVRGDLEALPFATGAMAGIFARHSYLHLPKLQMSAALREAGRVLAPDGILLISMIEGDYEGRALPGDDLPGRLFALWTEPELITAVTGAGLACLAVDHIEHRHGEADLLVTAVH
ncbi:MAG: class I SAM-dependent methyltransferase [Acidimicrobiales bacterium]